MRKFALIAAVITAAVVAAPVANAKIVVQKSIAGVALGISENDVVATLGQPAKSTTYTNTPTGVPARELDYGNTIVYLGGGSVTSILTRSKKERTANGAGVGTSEKQLKKKVKGLRCSGSRGNRGCIKGSAKPGTVITTFLLSAKKRVKAILVGVLES